MQPNKKYQISDSFDETSWRRFLKNNPRSNIFHTPEMFEVFNRTKGYTPQRMAVLDSQANIQAISFPVLVSLKEGVLRKATTRAIHYGGLLYEDHQESLECLRLLLPHCLKSSGNDALFTELRHLADPADIDSILNENRLEYEIHLNYLVNLNRPVDEVWKHISSEARGAVKRSQKRGLVIEEMSDISQVSEFYQLLKTTYDRKRIPLIDISHFEAIFDILVPMNMAKMYRAKVEDQPIAGFIVFLYNKTIYWWYSGDNFNFRKYYPTDGIIWHVLEWGCQENYTCFDVGWAGRPDEPYGVRKFKEKYGGQQVTYGRHRYIHAPMLMHMSTMGYNIYRILTKIFRKNTV
ncbi:lipid II:glycine glycyltransferase FemX [bacterium]